MAGKKLPFAEKIRIGVVFGGRSSEHEISILSAASVLSMIDTSKYETVSFFIDKSGHWHLVEKDISGIDSLSHPMISRISSDEKKVSVSDFDSMTDFIFPLLHGPYGEDGTIQGLFEMIGKPYAGCGVAAAAISMDKVFTKNVWQNAGLPGPCYTYTTQTLCKHDLKKEAAKIENKLSYPVFIKPANMGSSVGVNKVETRTALESALENALKYDKRVIAEQAIAGRELEIAVIGNERPMVSAVGEILPENDYYDFDSKYKSEGTKLDIPADIPESLKDQIESLALKAYNILNGEGFARIDLFYDEKQEKIYLNEMNAIPGFTKYSMFPLLWQAKGIEFSELIERIIGFGYERYNASHYRESASRA